MYTDKAKLQKALRTLSWRVSLQIYFIMYPNGNSVSIFLFQR